MKKLKLIDIMIEYFKVGNEKFNSYLVKIVKGIIESKELTLTELNRGNGPEENFMVQLTEIIESIRGKDMAGWCVDDLLDMIYELLHYVADVVKDESLKDEQPDQYQLGIDSFKILGKNMQFCISLLNQPDERLADKASQNMIGIV